MVIEYSRLSPGKGRWPKDPHKRALRKYQLDAATKYKRANEYYRYGTLGAASSGHSIDPATYPSSAWSHYIGCNGPTVIGSSLSVVGSSLIGFPI
jgi:hypothetical protein